jgi:drug/metabolite transporter (DMT)-like permease
MIFFSFSYRLLSAGTGALILFGAVQMTMIGVALRAGERLSLLAIGGLIIAIGGLVVLLRPGVSVPDPAGALLMGTAGVAWGVYSLRGRGAVDPTSETTINFLYALPFAITLSVLTINSASMSVFGASLAVASGALTSGLGYVIWYTVVPSLGATKAASVQLSVPAIAAVGGVLLLSEPMSLRVIVATILLISGISLVLWNRRRQDKIPQES